MAQYVKYSVKTNNVAPIIKTVVVTASMLSLKKNSSKGYPVNTGTNMAASNTIKNDITNGKKGIFFIYYPAIGVNGKFNSVFSSIDVTCM